MGNLNIHEEGQGLLEYALILVLVVLIVIVLLAILGPKVGQMFSSVIPLL
jgi:pilus assembly protein Flp/PilA